MSTFIINYTLYIIHYTTYIIHYILYIIHYTLYIIHYTLYIIHYTLYIHYNSSVIFLKFFFKSCSNTSLYLSDIGVQFCLLNNDNSKMNRNNYNYNHCYNSLIIAL